MKDFLVNEKIKSTKVQLIFDGINKGIVNKTEALGLARENHLDLVQFGTGETPICKIIDFGKYKFEISKKEKHNKQKPVIHKEIRMRISTEENDFNLKFKKIIEFLKDGDFVRVTIKLNGREKQFRNMGVERLNDVCEKVKDIATFGKIENSEKTISVNLTPIKKG